MFLQPRPITGCVRPQNRLANQWLMKILKKSKSTKCGIFYSQKNKKWIIKALDRHTRWTVAWVVSGRNATKARKLYNKLSQLKDCTFYTDDWDAFTKFLPRDRHIIGKKHTIPIVQDNSYTRHHLGRMTRRTKIVSRSEEMIYLSMTIWYALNTPEIFSDYQKVFVSIYNWTVSLNIVKIL